jgi:enoyl-CoA hydratase/carnithine racemase
MSTLKIDRRSPSLWRVTFANPPINLIDAALVGQLQELLTEAETDDHLAVIVFDSADPEFYLAHWDIAADPALTDALPSGPTGMHPWLDVLTRLSRLPQITVAALRGRARGAGSEFALAADIRFASRERAVLGQFELGAGAVPGGGPATRLPRLVGRGRALEILASADDYDADLAERYGYVNRSIPDDEFTAFVDRFAERVATFDTRALREAKSFVNSVSLPPESEFPAQMDAFWASVARPETQARTQRLFALGLQQRGDAERHLGSYLDRIAPNEK